MTRSSWCIQKLRPNKMKVCAQQATASVLLWIHFKVSWPTYQQSQGSNSSSVRPGRCDEEALIGVWLIISTCHSASSIKAQLRSSASHSAQQDAVKMLRPAPYAVICVAVQKSSHLLTQGQGLWWPTSAQKPVSKLTSGSTSSSASKLEYQELASELKSV